jgi:asparagine synthase (glutamine-hydrolysing)
MCGIAGVRAQGADGLAGAMVRALRHRGPDACGVWHDAPAGIALGHTRLSVLDLSAAGSQPMLSACGRHVIVFNGEIYNHLELRERLQAEEGPLAAAWRGHSDTETVLACVARWGLARTLRSLVGMFAFALWDRNERVLHLARDRLGEKPLYYGWVGGAFAFASELKALRALPGFDNPVDRAALALYLRHSAVPAPYSIYAGISKLPAASALSIPADRLERGRPLEPAPYWDFMQVASQPALRLPETEAIDQLESVLAKAIAGQLVADVPVGAFLSGGIDSSTVAALAQAQSARRLRTFSIGFLEQDYDEARHAKAVAAHLGTDHTELYVTPTLARGVIPSLPAIYCEPFADPSQIATCLVARLARQHVTVCLSGDGGDELFGGYHRHFLAAGPLALALRLPKPLRLAGSAALKGLSAERWNRLGLPGARLRKGADVLSFGNALDLYRRAVTQLDPRDVLVGAAEPELWSGFAQGGLPSMAQQVMALDTVTYLPDVILAKLDRAAMAVSLESRVPFLDHRVVEFAWRVPLGLKIRNRQGKWILRQLLRRHVPRELTDRPKMGFTVPVGEWLRGPLREWAEDMLDEAALRRDGFFQPARVRELLREHLDGRQDRERQLWNLLMFQAWKNDVTRSSRQEEFSHA